MPTTLQHFKARLPDQERLADAPAAILAGKGASFPPSTRGRVEIALDMKERLGQLQAAAARPLWHPNERPRPALGPRALSALVPDRRLEAQRAPFDVLVHPRQ
jgi:hypothetical protein